MCSNKRSLASASHSSWRPCLRSPLAHASGGLARHGATAATWQHSAWRWYPFSISTQQFAGRQAMRACGCDVTLLGKALRLSTGALSIS